MKRRNRKTVLLVIVWMLSVLVPLRICAYYIQYDYGSAYRVVGVKNDLSSGFSSAFEDAVDAWNGGISDRSIKINANAGNSITDLDFSKATDISYDLTFLFQKRYSADALYKPWSTSTTTCCSKHQTTSFIIYVNTYMVPSTEDYDKKLWVITHEL